MGHDMTEQRDQSQKDVSASRRRLLKASAAAPLMASLSPNAAMAVTSLTCDQKTPTATVTDTTTAFTQPAIVYDKRNETASGPDPLYYIEAIGDMPAGYYDEEGNSYTLSSDSLSASSTTVNNGNNGNNGNSGGGNNGNGHGNQSTDSDQTFSTFQISNEVSLDNYEEPRHTRLAAMFDLTEPGLPKLRGVWPAVQVDSSTNDSPLFESCATSLMPTILAGNGV